MQNITKQVEKVLDVQLWLNVILLITVIFYSPKWLIITAVALNLTLTGTYKVIKKYSGLIGLAVQTRKSMKFLNKIVTDLNG